MTDESTKSLQERLNYLFERWGPCLKRLAEHEANELAARKEANDHLKDCPWHEDWHSCNCGIF